MKEFEDYLEVELVKLRKASLSNFLFRFIIYDLSFPLVNGVNIINYSASSVIGGASEIVGNNVSLTFIVYDSHAIVFNRSEKTEYS